MSDLVLLPADERPVHLRYPQLLADIAGARLHLPPADALPRGRIPGDTDALASWLESPGVHAGTAIVSIDALCHGGLLASRLTGASVATVVARLDALRRLRRAQPGLRIDAYAVVTRLPDLDDASEEPEYWAHHGRALARWSRALHRGDRDELDEARRALPDEVTRDVARRRLRNHTLLLATLALAEDGTLDHLVLSADDTAPVGLPAAEASWLDHWVAALGAPGHLERYAGADEIASVRLVRALRGASEQPRVALWDHPGLDRTAPYEAVPIRATARSQVAAVGGRLVADLRDAEVVLVVLPPEPTGDWALAPPAPDAARDRRHRQAADRIAELVEAGAWVAVADTAFPNGGSPALVERLAEREVLASLGAYAGWNTAGNTIGSALAHAVIGRGRSGPGSAHERLLVHRLVEDLGYMARVRTELRKARRAAGEDVEPASGAEAAALSATVGARLAGELEGLGALGARWRLAPDRTRLVWSTTFACDLEVVAADG
ncbi:MAG: DUF4127 family protein [Nitriliruptoraceae bacterium]